MVATDSVQATAVPPAWLISVHHLIGPPTGRIPLPSTLTPGSTTTTLGPFHRHQTGPRPGRLPRPAPVTIATLSSQGVRH